MSTLGILSAVTGALVGAGVWEATSHRRRLARIPIRIHVNGTRGKSSVTRLIAAGLRADGIRTCAKTTGTLARMILPDGEEYPVYRPGRPNVIEQTRIIETAADHGAEAIVLECMALQPSLQWLCESQFIRATHGVITNARADHLEVMGPSETDVARALCGMVPPGGLLFTGEQRNRAIIEAACRDRRATLIGVSPEDWDRVSEAELAGFRYVEHRENVALALRVCHDLGIDRRRALEGMWQAKPDPGVMTEHTLDFFGRRIVFVNGFAANDPESTQRIWEMALDRYPNVARRVAVFNCRDDRLERSVQLAEACAEWRLADSYILIGSGTYFFAVHAIRAGIDSLKLIHAEGRSVEEIFEIIVDRSKASSLVMGMGNIGGPGLDLVRYFRNRSTLPDARLLTEAA